MIAAELDFLQVSVIWLEVWRLEVNMWSQSGFSNHCQSQPAHPFYHVPYRWVGLFYFECLHSFYSLCNGKCPSEGSFQGASAWQLMLRQFGRFLLDNTRLNLNHVHLWQGLCFDENEWTALLMSRHRGNPTGPVKLACWVSSEEMHQSLS